MKKIISERDAVKGYIRSAYSLTLDLSSKVKSLFEKEAFLLEEQVGIWEKNFIFAILGQNLGTLKNFQPSLQQHQNHVQRLECWIMVEIRQFLSEDSFRFIESDAEEVRRYQEFQWQSFQCGQNPFENITEHLLLAILGEQFFRIRDGEKREIIGLLQKTLTREFILTAAKAFDYWNQLYGEFDITETPVGIELSLPYSGQPVMEKPILKAASFDEGIRFSGLDDKPKAPSTRARDRKKELQFLFLQAKEYLEKRDHKKYLKRAIRYLRKASRGGHSPSQALLATILIQGKETRRKLAFRLFKSAAKKGNFFARKNLAFLYYQGKGTPRDYEKALYWLKKVAKPTEPEVQRTLGIMYYAGQGTRRDLKQAVLWLTRAASRGDPGAAKSLGIMYFQGEGLKKNYRKAFRWFRQSARAGEKEAQYNLAIMYFQGFGVPANLEKAQDWLHLLTQNCRDDRLTRVAEHLMNLINARLYFQKPPGWFDSLIGFVRRIARAALPNPEPDPAYQCSE